MTTTVSELMEMGSRDFEEAVTEDLRVTGDWRGPFMQSETIDRTRSALSGIILSVARQLEKYSDSDESDEGWSARTESFKAFLENTLKTVDRRIASLTNGIGNKERAWRAFAHELCEIIEESNLDQELDDSIIPFGDLTARQWLARRREKDPSRLRVAA